jgi:Ca2+:H+ antiporter
LDDYHLMSSLADRLRSISLRNRIFFSLTGFCPLAFLCKFILSDHSALIFCTSILAIVPLGAFSTDATEHLATFCGSFVGGFINAGLGNIAELIFIIIAVRKGLIDIVKASLLGAVTSNVCLGVGLALFIGGLRFKEQTFGAKLAGINAASLTCLLIVILCKHSTCPYRYHGRFTFQAHRH